MKTTLAPDRPGRKVYAENEAIKTSDKIYTRGCSLLEKKLVWTAMKLRIFYLACIEIRQPKRIWTTYRSLIRLRRDIAGGDLKKLYRVNGKYYFSMFSTSWLSIYFKPPLAIYFLKAAKK